MNEKEEVKRLMDKRFTIFITTLCVFGVVLTIADFLANITCGVYMSFGEIIITSITTSAFLTWYVDEKTKLKSAGKW